MSRPQIIIFKILVCDDDITFKASNVSNIYLDHVFESFFT